MNTPFLSSSQLAQAHLLVVGDVMLDRYWFGNVERISPEAPVPVVNVKRQEERLGGAANVARNAVDLGAKAGLLSVVGQDEPGKCVQDLLKKGGVASHLQIDANLPTTIKLRILSHQQQLLRVDFEDQPTHEILLESLQYFEQLLPQYQTVIFSDYAKGGLSHIVEMIEHARQNHKKVLVDPKGAQWEKYRNTHLITPNRAELKQVIGSWENETSLQERVTALRHKLNIEALLLTRSEEGMTLFTDDGRWHVPTVAREVFDVSGAGDTVIATVAAGWTAGLSLQEAVILANRAAGIVVSKLGTATASYEDLFPRA